MMRSGHFVQFLPVPAFENFVFRTPSDMFRRGAPSDFPNPDHIRISCANLFVNHWFYWKSAKIWPKINVNLS